ncbi:MAG: hypothetical protein JW953_01745 [Anaerolineae bacterium]|nr:hypothetical protein [Anaerolineae bacterium]
MKSVNIREDIAQRVAFLASRRRMTLESLINKILEQYIVNQAQEQSGTDFLLSIAGMFDSGPNDTSENVRVVVADAIIQKHHGTMHEGARR